MVQTINGFNEQTDQNYLITIDELGLCSYSEPCGHFTIKASEDLDGEFQARVDDAQGNKLLCTRGHYSLDDALNEVEILLDLIDVIVNSKPISWYSPSTLT